MDPLIAILISLISLALGAVLRPHLDTLSELSRVRFKQHGVRMLVEVDPDRMHLGAFVYPTSFFFPEDQEIGEPPGIHEEWWAWAHSLGGEDVYNTAVVVTLQATRDVTVAVEPPQVENQRQARPPGVVYSPEGMGGDAVHVRRFYIDLDEPKPKITYGFSKEERGLEGLPSFQLTRGDTERIEISARARTGRHVWRLSIPILVNGRRVLLPVRRDEGRAPFITVGNSECRIMFWDPRLLRWVEGPSE